jgi:hypothetical protein
MATTNKSARYVAYKPTTTFRDVLRPEEKVRWPVCSTWFEELVLPHFAFGTHVTIPGRPAEGAPPQETWDQRGKDKVLVKARNNRYGFALCPPGKEVTDMGQVHTLALLDLPSKRIAMDVIGLSVEGVADEPESDGTHRILTPAIKTSELFEKGFFVPEAVEPTDEEIRAAEGRRQKYLVSIVEKADRAWNNSGGKSDNIHPDAIKAARWLGQSRPWAPAWSAGKKQIEMIECPVCGAGLEKGRKKCLGCNEWIGYEEDGTPFAVNDPSHKAKLVAQRVAAAGA